MVQNLVLVLIDVRRVFSEGGGSLWLILWLPVEGARSDDPYLLLGGCVEATVACTAAWSSLDIAVL